MVTPAATRRARSSIGVSMLNESTVLTVLAVQGQFHYTTFTVEGQRLVRQACPGVANVDESQDRSALLVLRERTWLQGEVDRSRSGGVREEAIPAMQGQDIAGIASAKRVRASAMQFPGGDVSS